MDVAYKRGAEAPKLTARRAFAWFGGIALAAVIAATVVPDKSSEGRLFPPGNVLNLREDVHASSTLDARAELHNAVALGDRYGVAGLQASGRVFALRAGTRVAERRGLLPHLADRFSCPSLDGEERRGELGLPFLCRIDPALPLPATVWQQRLTRTPGRTD